MTEMTAPSRASRHLRPLFGRDPFTALRQEVDEDIDIEVAHNSMRVSSERKEEKEEKGKSFHRVERRSGKFSRTISLPCAVQENKIQAEYHDGVLSVLMPKAEEAKAHRIKIAAK